MAAAHRDPITDADTLFSCYTPTLFPATGSRTVPAAIADRGPASEDVLDPRQVLASSTVRRLFILR